MRIPVPQVFPARNSLPRLLVHALTAWMLGAALLIVAVSTLPLIPRSVVYTLGAPALTALVAAHFFRFGHGEEPLLGALGFTAVAAAMDAVVAAIARGGIPLLDPAFGFGVSLLLIFGTTGLTGELVPPASGSRSA